MDHLQIGTRVTGDATTRSFGRTGTVTRVIDAAGSLGGLVEVQWDGESRPSRSAGFEGGNALTAVGGESLRHRSGLVSLG